MRLPGSLVCVAGSHVSRVAGCRGASLFETLYRVKHSLISFSHPVTSPRRVTLCMSSSAQIRPFCHDIVSQIDHCNVLSRTLRAGHYITYWWHFPRSYLETKIRRLLSLKDGPHKRQDSAMNRQIPHNDLRKLRPNRRKAYVW